MRNDNAKIGDVLVLTKPIGTGIISTAFKRGNAKNADVDSIISVMTDSNSKGSIAMNSTGLMHAQILLGMV